MVAKFGYGNNSHHSLKNTKNTQIYQVIPFENEHLINAIGIN